MIDPVLDDVIGRHHDGTGECDSCTEALPEDFLLNDHGQFCGEACEADYLEENPHMKSGDADWEPRTLTEVATRKFGLRETGGRL